MGDLMGARKVRENQNEFSILFLYFFFVWIVKMSDSKDARKATGSWKCVEFF